MKFHDQQFTTVENVGSVPVPEEIYSIVGTDAVLLTPPEPARHLVMCCEAGAFRIKPGDHVSTLTGAVPGASVTNGQSSFPLAEGTSLVMPAPSKITVAGQTAGSVLTFFWA